MERINSSDRIIVLLSGGQDSVTCLLDLLNRTKRENVVAISFLYDAEEKQCVKRAVQICKDLGVKHKIFDLKVLSQLSNNNIVYGRNLFFICSAALYAKNNNYNKIIIGLTGKDLGIYNDCKASFVEKVNTWLKFTFEFDIEVLAPYGNKCKSEVWEVADKLGKLDYVNKMSYSCWKNGENPCGKCLSCRVRREGLNEYKRIKANNCNLDRNKKDM